MTKEEFVQEAALRLINTELTPDEIVARAESVADEVWAVTQKIQKECPVVTKEQSAKERLEDYQALCSELNDMYRSRRGIKGNHIGSIVSSLMNENRTIPLGVAKSMSFLYGRGITEEMIRKALENGTVEGVVPKKKSISTSIRRQGCYGEATPLSREQPLGKYELQVKSFVKWLDKNYNRQVGLDTTINKYLDRIINQ